MRFTLGGLEFDFIVAAFHTSFFESMEIMMAQQKKSCETLYIYCSHIKFVSTINLEFENNILSFVFLFAIVSVHDDESRSYIFKFA